MAITLYVEGQGTIFAEYDGYWSSSLISKAIDNNWITIDTVLDEYVITADAWKQGVRKVIIVGMDDNGKSYETIIADTYEEDDNV